MLREGPVDDDHLRFTNPAIEAGASLDCLRGQLMELMSPIDSLFLAPSRASIRCTSARYKLYTPPAGVRRGFVRDTHQALLQRDEIAPLFRKRPMGIHGAFSNLAWTSENDIDLDYHVRRSALPSPGRVRELPGADLPPAHQLARPTPSALEMHLIEGLKDGRVCDLHERSPRIGRRGGRNDADAGVDEHRRQRRRVQCPLGANGAGATEATEAEPQPGRSTPSKPRAKPGRHAGIRCLPGAFNASSGARGIPGTAIDTALRAPRTMLNVPVGGARRCAAQSWPMDRVNAVKAAAGVSLNDVVLAMCAGALRAYLDDNDALPERRWSPWSR